MGIDIYNLEAEAYGASVTKPVGNLPPSVERPPYRTLNDLLGLPTLHAERDGRIPLVLEAASAVRALHPEADIRIPISGPFSIATTLLGFEPLLYEILAEPQQAARALEHLAAGQRVISRAAAARDLEVLLFESAAAPPLLSPALFEEIVLPPLRSVMEDAASALGHRVGVIMGGNVVPILASLLTANPSYLICPVESGRAAFMEAIRSAPDVTVRINTPPEVYVRGPWERIEQELRAAAELAGDRERTLIGTGVLTYDTDPALVLRAAEFVSGLG